MKQEVRDHDGYLPMTGGTTKSCKRFLIHHKTMFAIHYFCSGPRYPHQPFTINHKPFPIRALRADRGVILLL